MSSSHHRHTLMECLSSRCSSRWCSFTASRPTLRAVAPMVAFLDELTLEVPVRMGGWNTGVSGLGVRFWDPAAGVAVGVTGTRSGVA